MDRAQVLFTNVTKPTSFGGVQPILHCLRKTDANVNLEHVRERLANLDSYTRHRFVKRRFPRLKVWAPYQGFRVEIDLLSMKNYSTDNDNTKYLLNVVDQFSRMAYSEPLPTKSPTDVSVALKKIVNRIPYKIQSMYADDGTEWKGAVKKFLEEQRIKFVVARSWVKASIVERFQRTLKLRIMKYIRQHHSYRYISALQLIVNDINNSVNRTVAVAPSSINFSTQQALYNRLYKNRCKRPPKFKRGSPDFAVGDDVIVAYKKTTFQRGYEQNFTDEVFRIIYAFPSHPATYRLEDRKGRLLPRKYYASELQQVYFDSNYEYDLEVRGRKGSGRTAQTLVHFLTEPDDSEEWIKSSSLLTRKAIKEVGPTRQRQL